MRSWIAFGLVLVGLGFGQSLAAAPKPKGLKSLKEGRDNPANYADKAKVEAFDHIIMAKGKKVVLELRGEVAEKWRRNYEKLGACLLRDSTLAVKNRKGKKAVIYRFAGGIIVAYDDKAFVLDWEMVEGWERAGGYKGPLGFPTSDAIEIDGRPPSYQNVSPPSGGLF